MTEVLCMSRISGPDVRHEVTEDGRWVRAIDRARASKHRTLYVSAGVYKRHSDTRKNKWHYQYLTEHGAFDGWECSCEAGMVGVVCDHIAALGLRLQREYRAPRLSDLPERGGDLFSGEEVVEAVVPSPLVAQKRTRLEDLWED